MNAITKDRRFSGSGSDTDILTSSARAYVSALNKLLSWTKRRQIIDSEDEDSNAESVGDAVQVQSEPPTVVELQP